MNWPFINDWLNLGLRWFHLIAGIAWIGSSFYFMWLDASLEPPKDKGKPNVEGELWMVHSGGFYQVEKRLIAPGEMPQTLHWFKWEATFTWISGFLLLSVVYYFTGGVYLLDPSVSQITFGQTVALCLGLLVGSWFVYDTLWQQLGLKAPQVAQAISLVLLFALVYGLCHVLSGRAAYIHVAAVMGTIMVTNVWVRILPAQQQMIDATKEGRKPNYELGMHAKRRSVHNSYMTFPVLFMMLSNHYPSTFGHSKNWLALVLLIIVGGGIRHWMITSSKKKPAHWAWAPVGAALAGLITMTAPTSPSATASGAAAHPVSFAEAKAIIDQRCVSCHSSRPIDDVFKVAPNGVVLETREGIRAQLERIKFRAVVSKTMPIGNKTGMTDDERALLGRWFDQGSRFD